MTVLPMFYPPNGNTDTNILEWEPLFKDGAPLLCTEDKKCCQQLTNCSTYIYGKGFVTPAATTYLEWQFLEHTYFDPTQMEIVLDPPNIISGGIELHHQIDDGAATCRWEGGVYGSISGINGTASSPGCIPQTGMSGLQYVLWGVMVTGGLGGFPSATFGALTTPGNRSFDGLEPPMANIRLETWCSTAPRNPPDAWNCETSFGPSEYGGGPLGPSFQSMSLSPPLSPSSPVQYTATNNSVALYFPPDRVFATWCDFKMRACLPCGQTRRECPTVRGVRLFQPTMIRWTFR